MGIQFTNEGFAFKNEFSAQKTKITGGENRK
nr:MAG TPA: hypothetical protein [Caudoviricetes sp.]